MPKKQLREGDKMPLSPKGRRRANRVSRQKARVALRGFIDDGPSYRLYVLRNNVSQNGTDGTE